MSLRISQLETKIKELVQKIALDENEKQRDVTEIHLEMKSPDEKT